MYVNASGKREVTEKLEGVQTSLALQEEVTRRGERERRSLGEEVAMLRSSLQTAEVETRRLQVREGRRRRETRYACATESIRLL